MKEKTFAKVDNTSSNDASPGKSKLVFLAHAGTARRELDSLLTQQQVTEVSSRNSYGWMKPLQVPDPILG